MNDEVSLVKHIADTQDQLLEINRIQGEKLSATVAKLEGIQATLDSLHHVIHGGSTESLIVRVHLIEQRITGLSEKQKKADESDSAGVMGRWQFAGTLVAAATPGLFATVVWVLEHWPRK